MLTSAKAFNNDPADLFQPTNFHMMLQTGLNAARESYGKLLAESGFVGEKLQTNRQQEFKVAEQQCLAEALMYVWAYCELPPLIAEYKIISVEEEIEAPLIADHLTLQVRADALLQSRVNENRYIVYSLKTNNRWTPKLENVYKYSTQGITEFWGAQQFYTDKTIEGVKFCHLIKGAEREDRDSAVEEDKRIWFTDNPLTRGWRKMFPTHMEYAHSFWFDTPANKSGRGRLGGGFERFYVWEHIGLSAWWNMIMGGQVQPELSNPIYDMRVSPPVYYKDEDKVKRVLAQITHQEEIIISNTTFCRGIKGWDQQNMVEYPLEIDKYFDQNFDACWFPTQCPMVPICHDPSVGWNPMGSGLYQIRTPHHEPERRQVEGEKPIDPPRS
jgi:hypothetical protein